MLPIVANLHLMHARMLCAIGVCTCSIRAAAHRPRPASAATEMVPRFKTGVVEVVHVSRERTTTPSVLVLHRSESGQDWSLQRLVVSDPWILGRLELFDERSPSYIVHQLQIELPANRAAESSISGAIGQCIRYLGAGLVPIYRPELFDIANSLGIDF